MEETLLNTKIVHGAEQTATAQTGDNTWVLILLFIAIISLIVIFKKKFIKVALSFILVFSIVSFAPLKSFADQKVSITESAEVSKDKAAELTITNNDDNTLSVNNFKIVNKILPQDTTWNVSIKDGYEIKEVNESGNISFSIEPHSTFMFTVYPNIDDIPYGELCEFSFGAVSNHFKANYINNDNGGHVEAPIDFNFSFQRFIDADNTQIDREIATFESVCACIPYTFNNVILDGKSYEVKDRIAFMRNLGFEDNFYCKLWPDKRLDVQADEGVSATLPDYTKDINDVTSFCFNHRKINLGSHDTEIINISVCGTGGDFEWASNFDYGAETDDYKAATGDHPEWTEKEDHKGFDIAKNRLLKVYNSYYSKYIDQNADKIILVNGHSRGGAIANLLGKHFENTNMKTFIYTFAAPNTTALSLNNANNTIFNIMNMDDLVSQFPGYISGFYKYGKDVELSVFNDMGIDGTPMSTIFKNKSGYGEYNGNDPQHVQDLIAATCFLIEDRESAYTLNSDKSKPYYKLGSYDTEQEALDDVDEFKADLAKYKLNYYAKYDCVEKGQDNKYHIKFTCCAAFIMQDISNWLFIIKEDYDGPFLGYNKELIDILKEALGVIPGIVHSHLWISYYLLPAYDKY
ncbi:MAG: hypothetical protein Q4E88_06660 [Coriobacteriia bacterium]|nr:hypothetical protein [Coriobacteriia bacterium]